MRTVTQNGRTSVEKPFDGVHVDENHFILSYEPKDKVAPGWAYMKKVYYMYIIYL
jgi:hypothetical protein